MRPEATTMTLAGLRKTAVIDYITANPTLSSNRIGKSLRERRPSLFDNVDQGRIIAQRIRKKDTKMEQTEAISMPKSKKVDLMPCYINDSIDKVLILSDIHAPYHDEEALESAIQSGVDAEVDCVVLNGDIADCYSVSSFSKDPEMRNFPAERDAVKEMLAYIRSRFPTQRIIYKEGNHEQRFGRLLLNKAPDLFGLPEFRLDVVFDLYNMGIEWVADCRPIIHGNITILHGHEIRVNGGINPARTALLKTYSNVIIGHLHKDSTDKRKLLNGEYVQAWSTGCLCEMQPAYMPYNHWTHGAAMIIDGKVELI